MSHYLVPLIAAGATWLDRAYGCWGRSAMLSALAHVQARQAVTVAAGLRYPTTMDAALVHLTGPGGAEHLDARLSVPIGPPEPWRSWVDEPVVSWAACILTDPGLAQAATRALAGTDHAQGLAFSFRSLLEPDAHEQRAGAVLRHPDLLGPVARLHRDGLRARLGPAENHP